MGEPNWYVARNGQRVGPHTPTQLKDMAVGGQLRQADMVWQEGAASWTAADTVPGLFGPAAEKPTPIEPPQPMAVPPPSSAERTAPAPADAPAQLVSCPACAGVVADNAYLCPHCGAPQPALERERTAIRWVLGMIFLCVTSFLPATALTSTMSPGWGRDFTFFSSCFTWMGIGLFSLRTYGYLPFLFRKPNWSGPQEKPRNPGRNGRS